MKKQKKDKRRQSTQQLMGIKKITDYCISTDTGDLVFYIVRPSNLGVLPATAIYARIEALKNVLRQTSSCWRSIPENLLRRTVRSTMTGSSRKRIRRSGACWNRTDSIWTRCRWK